MKLVELWCLVLAFSDSVGTALKNIPIPRTAAELLPLYTLFGVMGVNAAVHNLYKEYLRENSIAKL